MSATSANDLRRQQKILAVICGQRSSAKNGFWSGAPEQQPELKKVNELTIANPGFVGGRTVSPLQKFLAVHVCRRVTVAVDGRTF